MWKYCETNHNRAKENPLPKQTTTKSRSFFARLNNRFELIAVSKKTRHPLNISDTRDSEGKRLRVADSQEGLTVLVLGTVSILFMVGIFLTIAFVESIALN